MKPHVLLFPFPGQGHLNSLMLLAHHLLSSNILVTIVHSQRSYSLVPKHPDHIRVEFVPDVVLAGDFFNGLKKMENEMEQVVERLSKEENPVTCIISDTFFYGPQDIANRYGIPKATFHPSSASMYCIGFHIPLLLSQGYIPHKGELERSCDETGETIIDCIPGVPPMRARDFSKLFLAEDTSNPYFQHFLRVFQRSKEAKWILMYSLYELESSAFEALQADEVAAVPFGSLFRLSHGPESPVMERRHSEEDGACLSWLGTQSTSSVLYIAFGSFFRLNSSELQELALGLENSQQPFLWVIRTGAGEEGNIAELLPEGFMTRTRERGRMISWAPQQEVLSHAAVGGFLSHCGWNSTMESMYWGVPMIGWPRGGDQATNLKFIADEWKIGMRLEKGEGDGGGGGEVGRKEVEEAVVEVMRGEVGRELRRRAKEVGRRIRGSSMDGSRSKTELDRFVQELKLVSGTQGGPVAPMEVGSSSTIFT